MSRWKDSERVAHKPKTRKGLWKPNRELPVIRACANCDASITLTKGRYKLKLKLTGPACRVDAGPVIKCGQTKI